ncbi:MULTISPECIES: NAD(P)/FAD-dependent oxidoreductase [unclassified Bradyrhizobium]|uniref:phytoene desaturase family protein n=1 Tax=unclassified Bradyrhizobium TaxID=2631580 RepID=UPI0028EEBBD5|nr:MULTISPECIES: NAD(P)/FAD-dependent oxidoreductase [unclassified Bradyrhizobium]
MSKSYDIVVVGSGHNGLTTAAYLAKAGLSVLVLEKNDWLGGGVVTKEILAPGFKFDLHSSLHVNIQANPLIRNDELKLQSKYGLKYLYPDAVYSTMFEDGSALITYKDVDRTCESIARISPRDAEAYRRFAAMSMKIVPMVTQSLFTPAPQQGPFYALLDQSVEGQEIFRALQMSKLDICREWFESDKLIIHLLKFAAETLTAPEDMGTGFILYTMPGMVHTYPIGVPVGGSGALVDALVACLEDHGAELRTEAPVEKVLVQNGRATSVRLASGEEIKARVAVVGQIHPWLIGDMVEKVAPDVVARARRVKTGAFSIMPQHLALNDPPKYKAGAEAGRVILANYAPPTLERFLRVFDNYRYGDMWSEGSTDTILASHMQCQFDETQCPPGKAAITVYGFGPFDLRTGAASWDERQWEIGDWLLERYREYAPNVTHENIIGRRFDTPLEVSRHSSMFQKGDVSGAGEYLHQIGGHRPNPELAKLKIPGIENLYLTGTAINVSSVSGAGRATAIRACQDLKINFDSLIG